MSSPVATERNRDLHALVQACPDAIIVLQDGRHVFANDRALEVYQAGSLAELAAKPALEYMLPSLRPDATERMRAMTYRRQNLEYVEEAIIRFDGTVCDIEVAGSAITYDGAPAALLVLRDITARKEIERAREAAERRFRLVFENAPVGMAVLDTEWTVTEVNPAMAAMLGLPVDELVGTSVFQWVHRDDRMGSRGRFARLRSGASLVETAEVRAVLPGGDVIWTHASTSTLPDADGVPASFILQLQDVSARRTAEERLKRQASTDQLTGLANRSTFTAHLQRAIDDSARGSAGCAVFFLDLDRFKVVNDSLGHGAGDQLLTQVAHRLSSCLRPTDLIARLGGDEFAVLVGDIASPRRVAGMARRLQESLKEPFAIDGTELHANASIGIAFAQPGVDGESLLRDADAAMYRAKACGGGTYVLFDENLRADCSQRMQLENGLYGALGRRELFLSYQPIVETATGIITGVEALLRWRRSDGTVLPPERFIPIAEETGLIVPIGVWVVREACQQLRVWRAAYPDSPPLSMAVNVSSRQLLNTDLVAAVLAELESIGPDRLTLEITETASAEINESAVRSLERLDERGVCIAIDDFGTGQSSLARLRQLPVRLIKIDRQFTANMTSSDSDRRIVRATLAMAQALGLETVAEGVETAGQAELLLEAGCVLAQGFLYDRPRPAEDLAARLARRHLGVAPGRRRPVLAEAPG